MDSKKSLHRELLAGSALMGGAVLLAGVLKLAKEAKNLSGLIHQMASNPRVFQGDQAKPEEQRPRGKPRLRVIKNV